MIDRTALNAIRLRDDRRIVGSSVSDQSLLGTAHLHLYYSALKCTAKRDWETETMKIENSTGKVLRINAPEWFQLPSFQAFLNKRTHPHQKVRVATYHRYGDPPNSWSDVFVPFEIYPIGTDRSRAEIWNGDGSDISQDEALEDVWNAIVQAAKDQGITHGIVWISNLSTDARVPAIPAFTN